MPDAIRPLTEWEWSLLEPVLADYARSEAVLQAAQERHALNARHLDALVTRCAGPEEPDARLDPQARVLVRVNASLAANVPAE